MSHPWLDSAHVSSPTPWRVLASCLLTALLASACGSGDSPYTGEDVGPLVLDSSHVHVLGASESMAMIYDMDVAQDGSVWLLNSVEPFFIGFGAEGTPLPSHGEEGGGPEQFRMPGAFVTGGFDGDVWVLDVLRHAFIRVSEPGGPWAQKSLPRDAVPPGSLRGGMSMLGPVVRTARLGDEVLLPLTSGSLASGIYNFRMAILGAELVALDTRTDSVRHVLTLANALDDPAQGFNDTEGGFPLWYRLWDACGDGLRVYDRTRNQLRGFTAQGEETEPVSLPPVRLTSATPRQFARAIFDLRQAEITGEVGSRLSPADSGRVVNEIIQGLKGSPGELAAYLPRYVDFRCSADGTMWLHPLDLDLGGMRGGPWWVQVSVGGIARDVRFPRGFDAFRFTGSRVWGIQRDAYDVGSAAWIDLPGAGGL